MRALRANTFGPPGDVLELVETPSLQPGPGQAVVDVEAASLNFADILFCQGKYQVRPEPPFTPGLEVAGTVSSIGEDADSSLLGRRVVAMTVPPHGAFAEQAMVDAALAVTFPDSMPAVAATAMFVSYQTSWVALHARGRLADGETLLVHAGAGGVGSAAIQLGVAAGARVIATAGGADKVARCLALGAEIGIDYRHDDFVTIVNEATDGRGADVIYDPVGGEVFDRSRKCVAWEGRILIIGFASGTIPSAPMNHALVKNYSIIGVHWGGYGQRQPGIIQEAQNALADLHAEGAITPVVDGVVDLEGVVDGLDRLANRATTGRVVLQP
jgi:NADPH2:quinone reductase